MALLWQQAQAPRVGLRRERLSYGHELMNLPESAQPTTGGSEHVEVSNESEVDILAPPKSDSSEAASPKSDSPSLHSESSPPTKRRKLHSWTNQHVDLTSPPPVKKGRVIGESRSSQPSNIRATQFTSSDPSSARSSSRGWKPVSHSQGLSFEKSSEPKHPFAEYYLSQSRPGRPYGKPPVRNFHKARPPKPEQQKVREEAGCVEPTVLEGTKGYKIYDTKAIQSSSTQMVRIDRRYMLTSTSHSFRNRTLAECFQGSCRIVTEPKVKASDTAIGEQCRRGAEAGSGQNL
ncbi:MAG: hypothetical protein LQ338_007698 [Usnochroma carphineum]|nr:MAG: hypothetical protein LQ338_007698 [Usnochroma carphineum]